MGLRALALTLLCFLSFALAAQAIRTLRPWPRVFSMDRGISVYLANSDDYEMIYLGSSFLAHGVDPRVVDAIVSRALGRPFRSLNLATAGALGLETDHILRRLLDAPPPRLRYVVIEATPFRGHFTGTNQVVNERTVDWHSGRLTALALRQLSTAPLPTRDRWSHARLHIQLFLRRAANLGLGPLLVRPRAEHEPRREAILSKRFLERAGYEALESLPHAQNAGTRREFLASRGRYEANLRAYRRSPISRDLTAAARGAILAQVAFLESRGIVPIYLMPPLLESDAAWAKLARAGDIPHFVSFASAHRYADLYARKSRWDQGHLSEAGARRFSQFLARRLAVIAQETEPQ
jgi:hypothetical protein